MVALAFLGAEGGGGGDKSGVSISKHVSGVPNDEVSSQTVMFNRKTERDGSSRISNLTFIKRSAYR